MKDSLPKHNNLLTSSYFCSIDCWPASEPFIFTNSSQSHKIYCRPIIWRFVFGIGSVFPAAALSCGCQQHNNTPKAAQGTLAAQRPPHIHFIDVIKWQAISQWLSAALTDSLSGPYNNGNSPTKMLLVGAPSLWAGAIARAAAHFDARVILVSDGSRSFFPLASLSPAEKCMGENQFAPESKIA